WLRRAGALANASAVGKFSTREPAPWRAVDLRAARLLRRRAVALAAGPRSKHSRQDEADSAKRPGGVALQRFLDAVIFFEHLGRDRGAGFIERSAEIVH